MKESKECSDREQRLLVSSFYDMGLRLARQQVSRPDGSDAKPHALLTRLRVARTK